MNPAKRTALRAAIVLATMGVLVIVFFFFPWNLLRGPIASYFGHQLGRPVAIAGDLNVKLGWNPRIQVDDVSIGNAAWSKDPQMAQVRLMTLRVELYSLFAGPLVVPVVELIEPQLLLEKNKDGAANWLFGDSGYVPDGRLGTIAVERGVVRYRTPPLRAHL